jgi:hypothetical protein
MLYIPISFLSTLMSKELNKKYLDTQVHTLVNRLPVIKLNEKMQQYFIPIKQSTMKNKSTA